MTETRYMRLIDNPSVAGPVVGEGPDYITIEHDTVEEITRKSWAFEPAPAPGPKVGELTERQIKALDWGLTVLIEQTANNVHSYEAEQAVDEICDLASLVELMPDGADRNRLMTWCEDMRREHQVRLDKVLAEEAALEAARPPAERLREVLEDLLNTSALNEDSIEPEDQAVIDLARTLLEETAS